MSKFFRESAKNPCKSGKNIQPCLTLIKNPLKLSNADSEWPVSDQ